jgi:ribosomal protein S18 acetylase RimI-like enzyme
VKVGTLLFREGTSGDLEETFALAERAARHAAEENLMVPDAGPPIEADVPSDWGRRRPLLELLAAQPNSAYWICERGGRPVGYARVVGFEDMHELAELEVDPEYQGEGVGRSLLERCWPGPPTPDLGRLVVASGAPAALSLYTAFGVMPAAGHWRLRCPGAAYLSARARELADVDAAPASALEPAHAVAEWKRLEPPAIGHRRTPLHEFFSRDRTCLACVDDRTGEATGLCWVGADGEVGPAVGARSEDLVPVVLAALDRVGRTQQPEHLTVYATSIAWWLLRRLRALGFRVELPAWIMSSVPLPGLDRYTPTRPPYVL